MCLQLYIIMNKAKFLPKFTSCLLLKTYQQPNNALFVYFCTALHSRATNPTATAPNVYKYKYGLSPTYQPARSTLENRTKRGTRSILKSTKSTVLMPLKCALKRAFEAAGRCLPPHFRHLHQLKRRRKQDHKAKLGMNQTPRPHNKNKTIR